VIPNTAPHVRHRCFSSWVEQNCLEWRLAQVMPGPGTDKDRADFFVYENILNCT
jgi:hypothetical protein